MAKKKKVIIIISIFLIVAGVGGAGWWFLIRKPVNKSMETTQPAEQSETVSNTDILTHLADSPSLNDFLTLIQKTSMATSLPSEGSFTVFAPDGEAFGRASKETIALLTAADKLEQQKRIVQYHIIPGYFKKADLVDGKLLKTSLGQEIRVHVSGGDTYVVDAKGNKYKLTRSDRLNNNGVVHVIDGVMLPQ